MLIQQGINPEDIRDIQVATNASGAIVSTQSQILQTESENDPICSTSEIQRTFTALISDNEEPHSYINFETDHSRISNNHESGNMSQSADVQYETVNQNNIFDENRINTDLNNPRRTSENQIKYLLDQKKKYVATANNLDLLPLRFDGYSLSIYIEKYQDFIREYSMTRFRNSNEKNLKNLRTIQCNYKQYYNQFKYALNSDGMFSNNTLIPECLFKGYKDVKTYEESINKEMEVCGRLIISSLKKGISNFYPSNSTNLNSNNERMILSKEELKAKFEDELKSIDINIFNAEYLLNICSDFNKIEELSFHSMSTQEIIKNILEINGIKDILNPFDSPDQAILVHEILVFCNLYNEKIETSIKKNHVISMCFLGKALFNYLNNIELKQLYLRASQIKNEYEKKCLKNQELKANFYGLLNICRFHNLICKLYRYDYLLFSLQIPLYISMVLEMNIVFDSETTIEFVSFILFVFKQENLDYPDFYNDKFEYFLEKSDLNSENIIKNNWDIVNKYLIQTIITWLKGACIFILENFLENDKIENNKNRRLRILYISQLHYMNFYKSKNLCFPDQRNRMYEYVKRIYERVEEFYGDIINM
ncbi:hypothetical protein CWI36_1414p0010 [Hamiltosporidium magnivora]|uniref:Uncharacterized protein n=1 Tax=Hamiltosporidium magnivora TaxID=148818 RepID=A0A4Q9L251_9MICR|nr:hypothetical protein CWI36_1414p0010 [Hamiltosporidium magnivora]